jgi:hypothetical protein
MNASWLREKKYAASWDNISRSHNLGKPRRGAPAV